MLHRSFDLDSPSTMFMTLALAQPGQRLLVDEIDALRAAFKRVQHHRPFRLDAWVALPDRMLCVWTLPSGDMDTAGRWRAIRRSFAASVGPGRARWRSAEPPRIISSVVDYADCVRQCWFAPVRQGLAARPEEWAHSSIHEDSPVPA